MRLRILCLTLLLLIARPAFAQDILSPLEFRDRVVRMVLVLAPDARVETVGDHGLVVRRPGQAEADAQQVTTENAYRDYSNNPETLDLVTGRLARLVALGPVGEYGHDRLIGILRHRNILTSVPNATFIHRPFAGDLVELLAFDSAEQLEYARTERLEEAGLTLTQAWALTTINMPVRLGRLDREEVAPGFVAVSGENGITPSALTAPDLCSGLNANAYRYYLVMDRNLYIEADANVPGMRDIIRDFAQGAAQDGALSATPLMCRDGHLVSIDGR